MWYSTKENKYIQDGTQFEVDGIQYPAQWLNQATSKQKDAIGLQEVIATNAPKSDKFYWVSTQLNKASLTYINTPKDLDTVKKSSITDIDNAAYSIMLPSDYMAGKAFETGTLMPIAWAAWRESIRQTAKGASALIASAISVDEVADIIASIVWDNDPNYVAPGKEAA